LNAAAITKPLAIQHLTADLSGFGTDIAVITETHLKQKHDDALFTLAGYSLFRRDRKGRRGGGVAVYVADKLQAGVWTCPSGNNVASYELLWVRVWDDARDVFIGALYHPPKPVYPTSALLDYLE